MAAVHDHEGEHGETRAPNADDAGGQASSAADTRASTNDLDAATASFQRYRERRDPADLERALLACAPALLSAARRQVGHDADDLVQDCFLVAIRDVERFDARRRLGPWLLGILHNLARSRRLRRSPAGDGVAAYGPREPSSSEPGPPAAVDRKEWLQRVRDHLHQVPAIYRPVLQGYLIDGEEPIDIARKLRRPPSTVRTQIERGLRELRRRLPAPALAGIAAMLASRSASARALADGRRSPRLLRLLGVAAVLAVGSAVWLWWDGGTPPGPPVAAAGAVAAASAEAAPNDAAGGAAPPATRILARDREDVRVVLSWRDGGAAAGVPVVLDPLFQRGLPVNRVSSGWRMARTDEHGEVLFAGLPAGTAALRLHDGGEVLHVFAGGGGPRTFAFAIDPAAWLTVRLVDAQGQPIEGGTVFVSCRPGGGAPGFPAGTTDASGEARVAGVLQPFYVWARAAGWATSTVEGPIRPSGTAHDSLTVQLRHRGQLCRGRVEHALGEPLPGASVAVWSAESPRSPPVYCRTDARGWFEAEGPVEGSWMAAAVAPGRARASVQVEAGEVAVLRPGPGGSVTGRIPLDSPERASAMRMVTRYLEKTSWTPFDAAATTVAPTGHFELRGLAPGWHDVGWFDRGSSPVATRRVLAEEGVATQVDFTAALAAGWQVRVVDESGRPLPDHLVRSESPMPLIGFRHTQTVPTGPDGIARLEVRDVAPQLLFVFLPGEGGSSWLPAVGVGPVVPGEATTVTVPDAARRLGSVTGRLPPGSVELGLRCGLELRRAGGDRRFRVAADGSFRADDLPAGSYLLAVRQHDGRDTWSVRLARFDFAPGEHRDLGVLEDPAFGTAIIDVDAAVVPCPLFTTLRDERGDAVEVSLLGPGRERRRLLSAGRYVLEYPSSSATTMERAFTVFAARETRVALERAAGAPCRIEVHAAGRPPGSAPLLGSLHQVGCSGRTEFAMPVRQDQFGWVADVDLQPGIYRFAARAAAGSEIGGEIVVGADATMRTYPFRMR